MMIMTMMMTAAFFCLFFVLSAFSSPGVFSSGEDWVNDCFSRFFILTIRRSGNEIKPDDKNPLAFLSSMSSRREQLFTFFHHVVNSPLNPGDVQKDHLNFGSERPLKAWRTTSLRAGIFC